MDNYQLFFDTFKEYISEREEQRQKNVNDYNMVNVVRKENAEVGMHSNVIFSLIDPNGLHYQDELFLKLFIQEVLTDLKDDFGKIISVKAEESTFDNRRIDFTIKSSKYYIGIEMKIDAYDLKDQLSHYEENLVKKSEKDNNQKVFIYYLTKDGKEAAIHSHNKITYKTVSFKKHILNWIEKCQAEVKNITNLNEAFENYKDIVKKITGQYKGKLMTFEDYLEDKTTKEIEEILDEIDKMQERVSMEFIKNLDKYLGEIEGKKEPSYSYIDIFMGEYIVRLYFNLSNSTLLLQIGNKENNFGSLSEEKRDIFREKYRSEIEPEGITLCNLNWPIGYGEINLGKVRFQTRDKILEEAKNITSKLSLILSNE